jgi:hypothetical protein
LESDAMATSLQLDSSEPEAEKEHIEEFHRIFSQLIRVQRKELRKFRRKHGFDDEVIRKHETQMDLDEERVKHRFEAFITNQS